jgi:hypothetical protein
MLTLKRKVKCHFMKIGDNVSKGDNQHNDSLFSFSTNKFQSFFISGMSVEGKSCGEITKIV